MRAPAFKLLTLCLLSVCVLGDGVLLAGRASSVARARTWASASAGLCLARAAADAAHVAAAAKRRGQSGPVVAHTLVDVFTRHFFAVEAAATAAADSFRGLVGAGRA